MNHTLATTRILEAERSVLGAILIDNDGFVVATSILGPDDFFRHAHGLIFKQMIDMAELGQPIDLRLLTSALERSGQLDKVDGPAYIASLVDGVPRSTNVEYYAQTVLRHSQERHALQILHRATAAVGTDEDLGDLLDRTKVALDDIGVGAGLGRSHEQRVRSEMEKESARREARRRLDAATRIDPPPFRNLADVLAVPIPPVQYAVQDLLPLGARGMLIAPAKVGKTTLEANYIQSRADGTPFLGRFQVRQARRIALLDTEMSGQLFNWFQDLDLRNRDRVEVMQLRGRNSSFNLTDPDVLAWWRDHLIAMGISTLILDNLRPVLDALGLKEDKDAGVFLERFDALLLAAGIEDALVVHHAGHGSERARGDSRLKDWPDVTWTLTRTGDDTTDGTRFFSAYGRDVDLPKTRLTMAPDRRLVVDLAPTGPRSEDGGFSTVRQIVLDALADKTMCKNDLEKASMARGLARKQARLAFDALVTAGDLTESKASHGAKNYTRNVNLASSPHLAATSPARLAPEPRQFATSPGAYISPPAARTAANLGDVSTVGDAPTAAKSALKAGGNRDVRILS